MKKAMPVFLGITLASFILGIVLALTNEAGSALANLASWLWVISFISFVCLVVSLVCRLVSKTATGQPTQKSGASRPGRFTLSNEKLTFLREMFGESKRLSDIDTHMIADILMNGDCQAAVVVNEAPLLVAADSEDMGCVAMLRFPDRLAGLFGLRDGSRLLSATVYNTGGSYVRDLICPQGFKSSFSNMQPIVADFIAADGKEALENIKSRIPEADWARAYNLGKEYLELRPGVYRTGDPRSTYKFAN